MSRRDARLQALHKILMDVGEDAPTFLRKVEWVESCRQSLGDRGQAVDRLMVDEITRHRVGLLEAQANQEQLKVLLDKLAATPWFRAVYLGPVETGQGPRVMVSEGGAQRVLGLADGVDVNTLVKGDQVFLSNERNVVVAKAGNDLPQCGEIATFDRHTPDGRLVLRHRGDEEIVVEAGGSLEGRELKTGDLIRWNRDCSLAMEMLPPPEQDDFVLEDIPDIGCDQVGGQSENLDVLLSTLTATLVAPEKAAAYGLSGRQSILMVGPPGCGKTLMAKVAAAEIARLNGKRCRFSVVKPGEFEDPYVGVTQQRIRNCFGGLRRAAEDGFAVLLLDEIEAMGRTRGDVAGAHHADRFLAALLAELDGFTDRSNVAVIAATNRSELIDPALLSRISDVEIVVNRPNMNGAREVFEVHLPTSLPYCTDGMANDTRREMIETAVSRLYSPNGHNEICSVQFRDGKTRTVTARELASGRTIEQICRAARQAAFLREVRSGEKGLRVADIETAISDAMTKLASTLTRTNVHAYLSDLPQDLDVVSVTPAIRRVAHPHRYLNVA